MDRRLRTIWTLFGTFLKIGAFTFGGGYAMIPLIQKEVVEKRNWITNEDVLDIIDIAETTKAMCIRDSSYPGLGSAAAEAGLNSDVPLLLGITLFSTLFVCVGNLIANLLYGVVDPRMQEARP